MEHVLPSIRLKASSISLHPWVFQKLVEKPATPLASGTVVDVVANSGTWLGRGFYNGHARNGLRILTREPGEAIDAAFFARRITTAIALRKRLLRLDERTDAYRLINSEGDELTGLVVDKYGPLLVLEFFAAGMYRFREAILAALMAHYPEAQPYWFAEAHVLKQESFNCTPPPPPPPVIIQENGVRFQVVAGSRHKTGYFLDQRENRLALSRFCHQARVLDLCCFSGGFSIYAKLLGQAAAVTGVDLDPEALAIARTNAALNGVNAEFIAANYFDYLNDLVARNDRYDVVIFDPPKATRSSEKIDDAHKRYAGGNRLAIQAVKPGGLLLTCSCSGLIKEDEFLNIVRRAAGQAGRTLQVLNVSGAGADHPFFAQVPEGRYLKALWCRVL